MNRHNPMQSDSFEPVRSAGLIFKGAGILAGLGGLFTWFIGFKVDGVEYSGITASMGFFLPGVMIVGIGFVLSAVADLGERMYELLQRPKP